jgi:hypothetical protein
MRLSPIDPVLFAMQAATAFAHFIAGRYDEALSWSEKASWEQPLYLPGTIIFAASSALEDAECHGAAAPSQYTVANFQSQGLVPV